MATTWDDLPIEMRQRYWFEMTSGRDLELGRVYKFHEISGEDIIAGGKIVEKRPGDKGTIYKVELSCLVVSPDTQRTRVFELAS